MIKFNSLHSVVFVSSLFLSPTMLLAQSEIGSHQGTQIVAQNRTNRPLKRPVSQKKVRAVGSALQSAMADVKKGNYQKASIQLYKLSSDPRYADKRPQLKYLLALMLDKMGLKQVSSYQFISVVRAGSNKYIKPALDRLLMISTQLEDDTILNYAMKQVKVEDFPKNQQDLVHFRIGEVLLENPQSEGEVNPQERRARLNKAAASFANIEKNSPYFYQAKYLEAYANAELNRFEKATAAFDEIINSRQGAGVTDVNRVAALIGKARLEYQNKKWGESAYTYSLVPRDTEFWHDALFEQTWAYLRGAKFRSALSNFQSLHSAYYDNYYLPESLVLRSIVYLYICKHDELEKVIGMFNDTYIPILKKLNAIRKMYDGKEINYFREMERINTHFDVLKTGRGLDNLVIPFSVARHIRKEGDYKTQYSYLQNLRQEQEIIQKMPGDWQTSAIGQYSKKAINLRISNTERQIANTIRRHVLAVQKEIMEFEEQVALLKFEMNAGKKRQAKEQLIEKPETKQVDQDSSRDFYVQNGYEYWPFRGEYWLDEIGNYHYLGTRSCNSEK